MKYSRSVALIWLVIAAMWIVAGFLPYDMGSLELFVHDQKRYFWYLWATSVVMYALSLTQRSWEKYLIQTTMLSHAAILAYFFLVIVLWLDQYLSSILIGCTIGLLLWTLLSVRRRIAVIVPMSIAIFIWTAIFVLPTYKTIPTPEQFYDIFGIQFHVIIKDIPMTMRDVLADIVISSSVSSWQQIRIDIQENSPQVRTYMIRRPTTIQFDASMPLYNTFGFVQFYDGNIVPLPAQASLSIAYTQTGYVTTRDGIAVQENIDNAATFIAYESGLLNNAYQEQRKQYFIDAVGGAWTQYLYVDAVVSYMLSYLSQKFPKQYQSNYTNYRAFKTMIGEDISLQSKFQEQEQSLNSLRNVILPGLKQSNLFGKFFD
jgi:hypothetical protein